MKIKEFDYELIRSKRKTIAIYVKEDGQIVVRSPIGTDQASIEKFILQKANWIRNARAQIFVREKAKERIILSGEEQKYWRERARKDLTARSEFFADQMNVSFRRLRINGARTRWGSCSGRGDINYTYLLMFAPEEAIDYVIVHELAHLIEMNHSKQFWSIVEAILPDYLDRRKDLQEFQKTVSIEEEGRSSE